MCYRNQTELLILWGRPYSPLTGIIMAIGVAGGGDGVITGSLHCPTTIRVQRRQWSCPRWGRGKGGNEESGKWPRILWALCTSHPNRSPCAPN